MSSLNPVFILPGALRERGAAIAEGLKVSVTSGAGQFCTKPGLVFGTRGKDWDLLERGLARLIEEAVPATMLHAGIRAFYQKGLVHAAQTERVDLVAHSKQAPVAVKTQSEAVIMKTTTAVLRFARPLCFQNFAEAYLPEALRNDNPLGIRQLVNGSPESPSPGIQEQKLRHERQVTAKNF